MAVHAQVEGVGTLEFPDGTDPAVIQRTVKEQIAKNKPVSTGEKILNVAEPVVEALGAAGGAALGTVAEPVGGTIVGAGLGYAGGRQLIRSARQVMGYDKPQTAPQVFAEQAKDVITGAGMEAGGAVLGAAVKPIAKAIAPVAEKIAARGERMAAIKTAEQEPTNIAIQQATQAGFRLPPSVAGGGVGLKLEAMSGKIQTEQALSRINARRANRLAADELGLSERQSLTEPNIKRLKEDAYKPYEAVKKLGRINSDGEFKTELASVMERSEQVKADYPEDFNKEVAKEIKKFDKPSADASAMLNRIKSLRERASRNMKSLESDKFELGLAQKKIATAMENLIDRSVAQTNPAAIADLRAARTQLAKIYNIEDALTPGGNVLGSVLKRQLDRGVPLSGGLKQIAETYGAFPRVMQSVERVGGELPFSALDYLVGGVGAVSNPSKALATGGLLGARRLARAAITSDWYQTTAIKPRVTKPSMVTQAARKIADQGNTLRSLEENQP